MEAFNNRRQVFGRLPQSLTSSAGWTEEDLVAPFQWYFLDNTRMMLEALNHRRQVFGAPGQTPDTYLSRPHHNSSVVKKTPLKWCYQVFFWPACQVFQACKAELRPLDVLFEESCKQPTYMSPLCSPVELHTCHWTEACYLVEIGSQFAVEDMQTVWKCPDLVPALLCHSFTMQLTSDSSSWHMRCALHCSTSLAAVAMEIAHTKGSDQEVAPGHIRLQRLQEYQV